MVSWNAHQARRSASIRRFMSGRLPLRRFVLWLRVKHVQQRHAELFGQQRSDITVDLHGAGLVAGNCPLVAADGLAQLGLREAFGYPGVFEVGTGWSIHGALICA